MTEFDDRYTAAYEDGHQLGRLRRDDDTLDARWAFADATKTGTFDWFKRGFEDGFDGKEAQP
jgi:hypothetical protein